MNLFVETLTKLLIYCVIRPTSLSILSVTGSEQWLTYCRLRRSHYSVASDCGSGMSATCSAREFSYPSPSMQAVQVSSFSRKQRPVTRGGRQRSLVHLDQFSASVQRLKLVYCGR